SLLEKVLSKAQQRHPLLKVRIELNKNGMPWFTSERVGSIPISFIERLDEGDTLNEFHKQLVTPFNYGSKVVPLFRVSLLTADQNTDLVLCCQHTITDGMSMAFLTRDIIKYLNNPTEKIVVLDAPIKDEDIFTPKIRRSIPKKPFRSKLLLFFLRIYHFFIFGFRKGKKVLEEKADSKHDDIKIHSWTLSEDQTKEFLKKCKKRKISVHSAICTAFLPDISTINNPVDLRNRLNHPIGESFGLFAGGTIVKAKYQKRKDFWANARRYQRKLIWNLRDRRIYSVNRMLNKSLSLSTMKSFGQLFVDIVSRQNPFAITNLRSLDKLGITFESDIYSVDSFNAAISNTLDAMTVVVFTLRKKMYFHYH
ncbi:MAG: condensation domain-containing protein, partial [Candidatus Heimdallarchaeota archaeon]